MIGKGHTDDTQRCIKLLPQQAIVLNSLAINNNNKVLFLWLLLFVSGTKALGPVTAGFCSPQRKYHYLSLHFTKHCLIQLPSVTKLTTVIQRSNSALTAIFLLASLSLYKSFVYVCLWIFIQITKSLLTPNKQSAISLQKLFPPPLRLRTYYKNVHVNLLFTIYEKFSPSTPLLSSILLSSFNINLKTPFVADIDILKHV